MLGTIAALLKVMATVAGSAGYIKEDLMDALNFGANLLEVGEEGKAELEALVSKWENIVATGGSLSDDERAEQRARSDELSNVLQQLADDVEEVDDGT